MNRESAFSRHLRVGAIATGLASIVFSVLTIGDIIKDAAFLSPEFAVTSIALSSGLPVLMAAFALWGSISAVRWIARGHTIVTALTIVLWILLQLHQPLPANSLPWILNTVGVVAGSAVIAWRTPTVWIYLVLLAVAGGILRYVGLGAASPLVAVEDGVSILEFTVVMAMLLVAALGAARAQDHEVAIAESGARAAAEALSQSRQRSRFAALVHDDVITTLMAASLANQRTPAIEHGADRAIKRLDSFLDAAEAELLVDMETLQTELRAAVTDVVDGVSFRGSFANFKHPLSGKVALVLIGAIGEAARNSARHAGTGSVNRELWMTSTTRHLAVEFIDDGPGFDLTRVAANRFGIRTSIRARIAESGGYASVTSDPGNGTVVRVEWPRDAR